VLLSSGSSVARTAWDRIPVRRSHAVHEQQRVQRDGRRARGARYVQLDAIPGMNAGVLRSARAAAHAASARLGAQDTCNFTNNWGFVSLSFVY